ncbi:MAG: alpha/beta hydrolase, partial [Bacteroidota bacterium]
MDTSLPIFFAHANGFPANAYRYFFQCLAPHPVEAIPVLGTAPYQIQSNWHPVAQQVFDTLSQQKQRPVIGLGHSLGAVVLLRVAHLYPHLFSHLILLDPPLFGWKRRYALAFARSIGLAHRMVPIAKQAYRRRDQFKDIDEARQYWAGKKFFQSFHSECFEDYVQASLVPYEAGGLTLRIPKKMEGDFFTLTPWRAVPTQVSMPAHYIIPAGRGVLSKSEKEALPTRFPDFEIHTLSGGHMFPLEKPDETADFIKSLIH